VLKNKHILARLRDRITSVDVSLDAAKEHAYSHIRGGRLETVIEWMKWMRGEGIRTNISFVTQRRN
jgi:MoaA/NifB/PqqE/SkfB family radical SAM enzyme